MEQQTKQRNDSLTISQPAQKQSARLVWLVEQMTILAEAMGESMTPARLQIYAGDLADIEPTQLEIAFTRARRELKFFPRIAELRELAGQGEKQQGDAEARAAWEVVQKFVSKYVSNDVYGNFGPEHGWHANTYPKLSDRILDTVRRTGGWKVYKCMDSDDMPFVQKRFFEEYEAWKAVQHIPLDLLLKNQEVLALDSPKQSSKPLAQEQPKADRIVNVCLKKISGPMTDVQLRDRREMLRQQAELLHSGRISTQQRTMPQPRSAKTGAGECSA